MMVAVILFTLVFECVTEWLEDRLDHSPTYLDMLHKVYAELMILGFIAFVLTIVIEWHVILAIRRVADRGSDRRQSGHE